MWVDERSFHLGVAKFFSFSTSGEKSLRSCSVLSGYMLALTCRKNKRDQPSQTPILGQALLGFPRCLDQALVLKGPIVHRRDTQTSDCHMDQEQPRLSLNHHVQLFT